MSTPNTTPTKSVLGKGLASLLPPIQQPAPQVTAPASEAKSSAESLQASKDRIPGISMLPVEQIHANEFQPRREFDQVAIEELAQSIRENGLIQPLVVRKNGDRFELIAGERRLRASKLAGVKMVPVVIRKSTNREALELAIVENIQRVDLNCVDEALAYFQLMQEFNISQEELGKKMGKDRATVANALRILKLSDSILKELKRGALSRGHAKALLAVEDAPAREKLAKEIIEKSLSVRQAEKMSQDFKADRDERPRVEEPPKKPESKFNLEMNRITQTITKRFMAKCELKGDQKKGMIQIHYGSTEDLYRILNAMVGEE